ncbi:hypothetical protein V8C42DRAFT_329881 [Trichoderma barbatum]
MDGLVKRDADQVLSSVTAPFPVEDIPLELLRIYTQPRDDDNVVNKTIYRQLIKQYIAENNDWLPELQDEFKSEIKLLEYRITKSTGFCSLYKIGRWMYRETTWARFWTLRVMFGPTACANQGWFEEFSRDYPMVMDDAPAGIVPVNFEKLFSLQEWTPEEPQMERWTFHSTNTTRYGKRKAVKVKIVGRKKPKFTTSSSIASSNNGTTTAISQIRYVYP